MSTSLSFAAAFSLVLATTLATGCADLDEAPLAVDETTQSITSCSFDVSLYQAKVTSGQGFTEGDLELQFEGEADNGGVIAVPGTFTMIVGGSYRLIGEHLKTVSITNTTKTIQVWTQVTELDGGGTNGTNDVGENSGSMLLDCNGSNVSKELTVNLYKNNGTGGQNGAVKVKFLAELN